MAHFSTIFPVKFDLAYKTPTIHWANAAPSCPDIDENKLCFPPKYVACRWWWYLSDPRVALQQALLYLCCFLSPDHWSAANSVHSLCSKPRWCTNKLRGFIFLQGECRLKQLGSASVANQNMQSGNCAFFGQSYCSNVLHAALVSMIGWNLLEYLLRIFLWSLLLPLRISSFSEWMANKWTCSGKQFSSFGTVG